MRTDRSSNPELRGQVISRRRVLHFIGAHAGALPVLSWMSISSAQAAEDREPLNRFPRMVHEFFVRQVRESGERHIRRLDRLTTKGDAADYVRDAQARIRQAFGPEPERTPLSPRITGTVERDGYRIEKVIFDSRPGFPVTANLYIPNRTTGPLPAVVGSCGHSNNGKAAEA